jgi:polyisoprenoid-binding protein YceI
MITLKSITVGALATLLLIGSSFTAKLASTYKVNTAKTSLKWYASKVTGKHDGTINLANGTLTTNGKSLTGGNFEIDMNTIVCKDLTDKETNGKLIGHLKSDDFFSVEKHKTAKFEIMKVVPKAGNEYTIAGKMTIKGITEEISFPATITTTDKEVKAKAKITLDRTKWDIRYGSGKFFEGLGDKVINDDFIIDLDLVAGL